MCPDRGYKESGHNITQLSTYLNYTYSLDELLSPRGLMELEIQNLTVKTTNSLLRGRCYTLYSNLKVKNIS